MRLRSMAASLLVMGAVLAIGMCGTAAYGAETFGFVGVDAACGKESTPYIPRVCGPGPRQGSGREEMALR